MKKAELLNMLQRLETRVAVLEAEVKTLRENQRPTDVPGTSRWPQPNIRPVPTPAREPPWVVTAESASGTILLDGAKPSFDHIPKDVVDEIRGINQ